MTEDWLNGHRQVVLCAFRLLVLPNQNSAITLVTLYHNKTPMDDRGINGSDENWGIDRADRYHGNRRQNGVHQCRTRNCGGP